MRPGRVVCAGEALVDLAATPAGTPLAAATRLRMLQGGSPANVAVGLCALGVPAALLGTVGADALGSFLVDALRRRGVDTTRTHAVAARTGLVFLSIDRRGERAFLPAREGTADNLLHPRHLGPRPVAGACWVHHSSGPLRPAAGTDALRRLRAAARAGGLPISVDVNLRPGVWPSVRANVTAVRRALDGVDVVKANLDEARALTGARTVDGALRGLRGLCTRLAVVTLGGRGAVALGEGGPVTAAARRVRVVDTTGAGDAFMAALIAGLLGGAAAWEGAGLRRVLARANRAGAAACRVLGATTCWRLPH
ncbi:MAG: carbohydrate kinase [Deltaproteobacteria bacterium]|nr:carbohydrate kinase [Deltaproteobacteria bacterium]